MKGYESYHPALLFLGYGLALVFSMISLHPFVIAASLTGSFLLFLAMFGWKKLFFGTVILSWGFCAPVPGKSAVCP